MRKIGRKNVWQKKKKMLREKHIRLWIRKLGRLWRRLIRVMIVVSCLVLPDKGLGLREMLLGLVVFKMKVGQ